MSKKRGKLLDAKPKLIQKMIKDGEISPRDVKRFEKWKRAFEKSTGKGLGFDIVEKTITLKRIIEEDAVLLEKVVPLPAEDAARGDEISKQIEVENKLLNNLHFHIILTHYLRSPNEKSEEVTQSINYFKAFCIMEGVEPFYTFGCLCYSLEDKLLDGDVKFHFSDGKYKFTYSEGDLPQIMNMGLLFLKLSIVESNLSK